MERGDRERGDGCWFLIGGQPRSSSSPPLRRSSLAMRCCFGAALSGARESGFSRFRVRRRMICSPLFCLMMFSGRGVCETEGEREREEVVKLFQLVPTQVVNIPPFNKER